MNDHQFERYSDQECIDEFRELLPLGFAADDVMGEIAPEGWEKSPLIAIFHPTLQQVFQEAVESHENLQRLRGNANDPADPPPTIEEIQAEFKESAVETDREVAELVGRCLWDVFSDNHDVFGPDGRLIDIGSFRGAGGFIADELNRQTRHSGRGHSGYGYMDFFMGTAWIHCRADVTIVYEMIFKRLRNRRLDWAFCFPRLHLVDLAPLRESLKSDDEPDWAGYSPESSFAKEREEEDRREDLAAMQQDLDDRHRDAVEIARAGPPPSVVMAYQIVYGKCPQGWPPESSE